MANANVNVIVGAVDNASNVLKNIGKNIQNTLSKQAKTDVSGLTQATSGLSSAFGKLAVGAGVVGIALGAAVVAIGAATMAAMPFINASAQMEKSLLALSRAAGVFGIDGDKATEAAKKLASDGLITVATASEGLQRLFIAGLGLDKSIDLMIAYKDQAALGRISTIDMDTAVTNLAGSFQTEMSNIGNLSGQQENYNWILESGAKVLGKEVSQLTDAERVEAKYIGTMKLGEVVKGDAAASAEVLVGKLGKLSTAKLNLSVAIGDTLTPAFEMLVEIMSGALASALDFVKNNMINLQVGVLVLTTTLLQTVNIIGGAVKILIGAFASLMTLSLDPLKNAVKDAATSVVSTQMTANKKMEDIAKKAAGIQSDIYKTSAKAIEEQSTKKRDKLEKDLQKETDTFKREMEKRDKQFKETLSDMIFAHIEKRDDIIKDLEEENKDYKVTMEERVKDFKEKMSEMVEAHDEKVKDINDQIVDEGDTFKDEMADRTKIFQREMDDMVSAHAEKVKDINDQILEENASFEEKITDKKDAYAENMGELKDSHEDKVKDIEKQIDRETAKGRSANQLRLEDLRYELEEENSAYKEKEDKLTAAFDKETAKIQEQYNKKLLAYQEELAKEELEHSNAILRAQEKETEATTKLKEELDKRLLSYQEEIAKEESDHNDAVAKAQKTDAEETASIILTHTERVASYQASIKEEEIVLSKHQLDVAALKNKEKEDDITRLKRKYEEQKVEDDAEHERKMKDIREKGGEEGDMYGGAIGETLGVKLGEIETKMKDSGKLAGENFANGIGAGASAAASKLVNDYFSSLANNIKALPQFMWEKAKSLLGLPSVFNVESGGFKQTGGIVPGPIGAAVPIMAHAGEQVIPNGVSGLNRNGGGGVTFNVTIGLYAGTETEKRNIAKSLYSALLQVAQSQNKNVQELMGG